MTLNLDVAKMKLINFDQSHFPEIASIYEEGISTGISTFETSIPCWEDWNNAHLPYGRLAFLDNSKILGWAALSPVSSRCVYGGVAELSIYVAASSRGKGIGKKLLTELIKVSEANKIWTLQAGIFRENIASIKLHHNCGFRTIGYREKIGKLNGHWYDNIILERRSKKVGI